MCLTQSHPCTHRRKKLHVAPTGDKRKQGLRCVRAGHCDFCSHGWRLVCFHRVTSAGNPCDLLLATRVFPSIGPMRLHRELCFIIAFCFKPSCFVKPYCHSFLIIILVPLPFPLLLRAAVAPPSYTLHNTSSSPRLSAPQPAGGLTRCHRVLPIAGELWVDGYGCRISKPLACICSSAPCLLHMSHSHTQPHTHGRVTQLEVSIPHGECFLASALNCNPWNSVSLTQRLCSAHPIHAQLPPVLLTSVPLTRISVLYGCTGSLLGSIHSDKLFLIPVLLIV